MNNFYLKLRQGVNSLPSQRFKMPKLETGFTMLEAVVVVGVLLALAIGGFLSYGPITENAKIAKLKSTAAEVYTAAQASNADGDPSTNPQDIIDTYNASTNKIHVEILEPGGVPLVAAMTTGLNVPAAYEPIPGEDFCVAATYVTATDLQAGFGACPADLPKPDTTPGDNTEVEPGSEIPATDDENGNGIPDSEEVQTPTVGSPGDKSHLPDPTSTEGYLVMKFDTSVEASCSTLNIPVTLGNVTSVNWGDGVSSNIRPLQHTYSEQGIRYVVLKGQIGAIGEQNWEDAGCLLEVPMWTDATGTTDMSYAFNNTTRLTSVPRVPITVKSLQATFKNSTFNGPINWNVPKLTTTSQMFMNNKSFNQPVLFNPDALQVTTSMFEGATAFNSMVHIGGFNRGISVVNVSNMFKDATSFNSLMSIGDGHAILSAQSMFENATSFNQPLTISLGNVSYADKMFKNATSFNSSVASLTFNRNMGFSEMFMGATSFNQPVSSFKVDATRAPILRSMFEGATSFNQPLSGWDTSGTRVVSRMFWNTPSFKQNLSTMKYHYTLSGTSTDFSDDPDRSWWPAGLAKP